MFPRISRARFATRACADITTRAHMWIVVFSWEHGNKPYKSLKSREKSVPKRSNSWEQNWEHGNNSIERRRRDRLELELATASE